MDNPCKYCEKAVEKLKGEPFKQWCDGTCEKFTDYADGLSKTLAALIVQGEEILKKHGVKIKI